MDSYSLAGGSHPSPAPLPPLSSTGSGGHEPAEMEKIVASPRMTGHPGGEPPRKRCAESEQRQSLSLRKNTSLRRHPTRDFSAFHSSDLFFCRLKGSKSSNGMGCGISFFRDGNAPGLPPRM